MRAILSLATLKDLDFGKVDTSFSSKLRAVIADLKDRPGLDRERQVILTLKMKPAETTQGVLDSVEVFFEVRTKVPAAQSIAHNMAAGKDTLVFSTESPTDHKQSTIDDEMARPRE